MPTWTGAISTDWNTAGNWSTPSAVPTAATAAIFTGTPTRNCTTGTAARACLTLDTTGYNGTLEIGSSTAGTLSVSGNVTIGSTVGNITGLANLIINATATLDVATGVTIPNLELTPSTTQTITLSRTTAVTNLLKQGSISTTITAGSAGILLNILNGTVRTATGTLTVGSNVTLTISGSSSTTGINLIGALDVPLGNTFTLNGGLAFLGSVASSFTCAGTFIPGTQTVSLPASPATITINMGSNSFYNLSHTSGTTATVTMLSNINVTNNLALSGTNNFNGAFNITVGGNLSGGTLVNSTAGSKISLTGTSTGTSTITSLVLSGRTLEIDCTTNNFVFTGTITLTNGAINYLVTNSGTFTSTGSTISYTGNGSINMNGSTNSWGTISNTGGVPRTLTLLSNVYCNTIGVITNTDVWNGAGFSLYVSGNAGTMSNISGTAGMVFTGSSNATWTQTNTNTLASIVFAKTGGATLNIPNSFTYTGGTMTYTSGLINHTATLTLGNGTTMNTSSLASWNNITISASAYCKIFFV